MTVTVTGATSVTSGATSTPSNMVGVPKGAFAGVSAGLGAFLLVTMAGILYLLFREQKRQPERNPNPKHDQTRYSAHLKQPEAALTRYEFAAERDPTELWGQTRPAAGKTATSNLHNIL
jgi:hypothetical protein